ncbi:hypothetical protein OUZ56_028772 [Daphnia magna]|uniref:Uncharacterized protein n=1 Tax=Daphnia magna TaxID=35525 RepID=A0ABR0B504_9CRUS|nr:hypothetical protein OUZ56_028772 [Daphnia magna]
MGGPFLKRNPANHVRPYTDREIILEFIITGIITSVGPSLGCTPGGFYCVSCMCGLAWTSERLSKEKG